MPSLPARFGAPRLLSLLVPVLAAAVAGCGADPDDFENIDEVEQEVTVCPKGKTIEGIDVSYWQQNVNWPQVKGAGIQFAIARVAQGTTKDTFFDQNWKGMKDVGLVRGAYQYFRPSQDPIVQANLVLANIGDLGEMDLPPVIDVETTDGMSTAHVVDAVTKWIQHVEAAIGRKPIIYTGKYFWQDNVKSKAFGDYPLWIPNYSYSCPNLPDGYWNDWLMFQYTDTGKVAGVSGNVDRNQFNGTVQDLLAFANGAPDYAAKFVSQSFPYASEGPLTMHSGESVPAFIELLNTGKKPWDANTRLATTEPRDHDSPFAGPEWPAANRYAQVEGVVMPGDTYKFSFQLHAPSEPGIYDEFFGLVHEGVAWFSDKGQGGPPDGQLQGVFEVLPGEGAGAGSGAGSGSGGDDGEGGEGGGETLLRAGMVDDGCAVRPGRDARRDAAGWIFVGLGAVAWRRRRR